MRNKSRTEINSNRQRRAFFEPLEIRRVLATFVVDSLSDGTLTQLAGDGKLSLREALEAANTNQAVDGSPAGTPLGNPVTADVITFAPQLSGSIFIVSELLIIDAVTIQGPGANQLAIDGQNATRIFRINNSEHLFDVAIEDLTLTHGKASFGSIPDGGAIYNTQQAVAVRRCLIDSNTADRNGGGLYNELGLILVDKSTVSNNVARNQGGGIYDGYGVSINNSTIVNNRVEPLEFTIAIGTTMRSPSGVPIANNRIELRPTNSTAPSAVFYQTQQITNQVLSNASGQSVFALGSFGSILGNLGQLSEPLIFSGAASVDIDIIVSDGVNTDDEVISIDDTIIGSIDEVEAGSLYSLGLTLNHSVRGSEINSKTFTIFGRQFTLTVPDFDELSGIGEPNGSGSQLVEITLDYAEVPGAGRRGGGIYSTSNVGLTISSTTIAGNTAIDQGGGLYSRMPSTIKNSIVAGNFSGPGASPVASDVAGANFQLPSPNNLFGSGGSGGLTNGANQNQVGVDWTQVLANRDGMPIVANNGGPTPTVLLKRGSPAIDAGDPNLVGVDQRGFPRVLDGNLDGTARADIGAIEMNPFGFAITAGSVAETESTLSFTVSLSAPLPAGQTASVVFITLSTGTATAGSDYSAVLNQTLNFDSSTQTIVVQVPLQNDRLVEENETIIGQLSAAVGASVDTDQAIATINEDDIAGFVLNKNAVTVSENGSTQGSFTVVLSAQPATNVVIDLLIDPSVAVDKTSLTFTTQNWNQAQAIQVSAVDNQVDNDNSSTGFVDLFVADTSDPFFLFVPGDVVEVTLLDDDTRGVTVSGISGDTTEAGGTATFTAKLNSQPTGEVVIPVASLNANEGTASVTQLVFTTANWQTLQTVTVTGADDTQIDGNVTYQIQLGPATGGDYATLDPADVSVVNLDNDKPTLDFGDAPASYATALAQEGARHLVGTLLLGKAVDAELNGTPSAGADGDGVDDDGINFVSPIIGSTTQSIASISVESSEAGKLDGWIDFNRDGDWNDPGEQILTSAAVTAGVNLLNYTVPAGASPGATFARFRLSSTGGLGSTGLVNSGEVEDYQTTILSPSPELPVIVSSSVAGNILLSTNNPPGAGGEGSSDVIVQQNGLVLFRSSASNVGNLIINGAIGDDVFEIVNGFTGLGISIEINGSGGFNVVRVLGAGEVIDLTINQFSNIDLVDLVGSGTNTLSVNLAAVQANASDELRISYDSDDSVSFGLGWNVANPIIDVGNFSHVLTQADQSLIVRNEFAYQNPFNSLDVNRSGSISPLDVLLIINPINAGASSDLTVPTDLNGVTEFHYIDTSGDDILGPLDVLLVINFLNAQSPSGEGELSERIATAFPVEVSRNQILNFHQVDLAIERLIDEDQANSLSKVLTEVEFSSRPSLIDNGAKTKTSQTEDLSVDPNLEVTLLRKNRKLHL